MSQIDIDCEKCGDTYTYVEDGCLYDLPIITNEFYDKIKSYFYDDDFPIYGISQNPNTKEYFMVFQDDHCEKCEIRKDGFSTIYSTIWEDGPLYYCLYKKEYKRKLGKKQVALKYMHNSQNITNELLSKGRNTIWKSSPLNEDNEYSKLYIIDNIYGLSQNPDTKDYIMFLKDEYCEKCGMKFSSFRPEINEPEIPKCYGELMKKCWDSNPNNRPSAIDLGILVGSFYFAEDKEIKKQFEKAEEYRKANLLSIESIQSTTHPEAYYTSRLLNPFTKNLYSMEVIDFTML
ncbi:kinase-like domain-containing protein [Rhizophagus irregularis DAOM 181602=DAOM 197198]|nr:kinase-like domain-containing protein [Rhizophagus irregularis DAOM 181602=DAOM 197198]